MNSKQRALCVVEALEKEYPDAVCSLESRSALELLIATRLSAQCTDARVNIVTEPLFEKYRSAADFANANLAELEEIIRPCGLYKTKARNIMDMCAMLIERFGGEVPDSMEALLQLPGVGRKTANLVLGDVFGRPAVVTDTHCIRIANRLGFADTKDPYKVELALKKLIPPERSAMFCHRLVFHGRAVCRARGPQCGACCLAEYCAYAKTLGQECSRKPAGWNPS